MINTSHLIKVGVAWMSIAYAICFAGVALFPSLRSVFMKYALHAEASFGQSYLNVTSFITGLLVWDIITIVGLWLFAVLFNKIRQ